MTGAAKIFWRLMLRPMAREPTRTGLTVLSIALGVAVVLAIDLAGTAATGSFHSSLETLTGHYTLEVTATAGVPDAIVGQLATLPQNLAISPRLEDFAFTAETKQSVVLLGLDLIGEANLLRTGEKDSPFQSPRSDENLFNDSAESSIWAGDSLGWKKDQRVSLIIGDRERVFTVRGVYEDRNQPAIVMDIADAQRTLGREGRVDRILIRTPENDDADAFRKPISALLPPGVEVRVAGTAAEENHKMLAAFRWNLKLLSYIALIVGAFLIYNTISVSVVRRRAEIGIARALGASRAGALLAFTGEAAALGAAGAVIGVPLGRMMASSAVKLMSTTVNALYVSSRPGAIKLEGSSIVTALAAGIGVAVIAAYAPAREASQISPVEAMARGRKEYLVRVHKTRDCILAVLAATASIVCAKASPLAGKPIFGYVAAALAVVAGTLAIPATVNAMLTISASILKKAGVEVLLASRSLLGSLRRTSVLVGALATAIAMMTAVGIMVGSFRTTVIEWLEEGFPADFYLRPAGNPSVDRYPTISPELADHLSTLPGVESVGRFRAYQVDFEGIPTTVAAVEFNGPHKRGRSDFFSGRSIEDVRQEMQSGNQVIVSEPFTYKHHVKRGDSIPLRLGTSLATFRIADVYYDYGGERGFVLMDRSVMKRYLPDDAPSSLSVYVASGADPKQVRREVEQATAKYRILIFSNSDLRREAITIFDKTFAITYALEAIAVLVAIMGVAGALLALVIDRKRELGLLRFLGAATTQIRRLILAEAALLGVLANFAGILLGFVLSMILVFVINKQSFGWTIRFHLPVAVLSGAVTLVFVATVLAAIYPARIAVELNPIEVVHDE